MGMSTDEEILKDLEEKYHKVASDESYRKEQVTFLKKQLEMIENDPAYVSPEIQILESQLKETGKLPVGTIVFVESKSGKALAGEVKNCTETDITIGFLNKYGDAIFKTSEISRKEVHVWIDQKVDIELIQSIFDDQPENMEVSL